MLIWVYTFQNATLLEITCHVSNGFVKFNTLVRATLFYDICSVNQSCFYMAWHLKTDINEIIQPHVDCEMVNIVPNFSQILETI